MKRYFLGMSLLLSGALAHAEPTTAVPDVAWSQAWLDSSYLPRHTAVIQAADALAAATSTLCAQPSAQNLELTRQSWLVSSQAWRAMDAAPAGPMVLERLGRKVDFRPTRPDDIEAAIQGGDISNAATRGLPAIEYLLWGNAQPKLQLAKLKLPERCAYLNKIAEQVASNVHVLDQPWQIYRTELGAENPFFRENLLSEHINLLLASMASLQKRIPTAEGVKPEQFVEWRSGSSHAQIVAHLNGLSLALQAVQQRLRADGATQLGTQLAKQVTDDLAQVQKTCQSLPQNLAQSSASARLACSKSIAALKNRVQAQVGEQFDLTLGFTEGDGD